MLVCIGVRIVSGDGGGAWCVVEVCDGGGVWWRCVVMVVVDVVVLYNASYTGVGGVW